MFQSVLPFDVSHWHDVAPDSVEERGAIFTRREVVDFVLDLAGYTPNRPLARMRLLEPSLGHGDFLLPAIDRLLSAWRSSPERSDATALKPAIRGIELHEETFVEVRQKVIDRLIEHELSSQDASMLAEAWLMRGNFLLAEFGARFDFVIGNPPYVRQELIPDALMAEYRARFSTIYDRANLYIPFIEKSLLLLAEGGHLGFICADRWMKNRYGGPLRRLVAEQFH